MKARIQSWLKSSTFSTGVFLGVTIGSGTGCLSVYSPPGAVVAAGQEGPSEAGGTDGGSESDDSAQVDDVDNSYTQKTLTTLGKGYDSAEAIVQTTGGQLLIAGSSMRSIYGYSPYVERLDLDGSPDLSFGDASTTYIPSLASVQVRQIVEGADGKIWVLADGGIPHQQRNVFLYRLTANGSMDLTFGTGGIVEIDVTAGNNETASGFVFDSAGRAVIVGYDDSDSFIVRVDANGSLDSGFAVGGIQLLDRSGTGNDDRFLGITLDSATGNYLVTGDITQVATSSDIFVARYLPSGALDTSFASATGVKFVSISAGADKGLVIKRDPITTKILVLGHADTGGMGEYEQVIIRLEDDGDVDATWGTAGIATISDGANRSAYPAGMAVQADGSVIALATLYGATSVIRLTKYTDAGILDVAYGDTNGIRVDSVNALSTEAKGLSVNALGEAYVAGHYAVEGEWHGDLMVLNYDDEGVLKVPFADNGLLTQSFGLSQDLAKSVVVDGAAGKVWVLGGVTTDHGNTPSSAVIQKFDTNFVLDSTLNSNSGKYTYEDPAQVSFPIRAAALQSDQKLVVAGSKGADFYVSRLTSSGALDTSFGTAGAQTSSFGVDSDCTALAVYPAGSAQSGKIVCAGDLDNQDGFILRLNTDGSVDTTFDADGRVDIAVSDIGGPLAVTFNSIVGTSDGQVIVAGSAGGMWFVQRYDAAGVLEIDSPTNLNLNGEVMSVRVQSDGKIVATGYSTGAGMSFRMERYLSNGAYDTSFSGDGVLEIATAANRIQIGLKQVFQSDGKAIAIVADCEDDFGSCRTDVFRITVGGELDSTFYNQGKKSIDLGGSGVLNYLTDIGLDADENILMIGNAHNRIQTIRLINP